MTDGIELKEEENEGSPGRNRAEESASLPDRSLLDLAAPERSVRLRSGKKTYRHLFRPLTLDDWVRYQKTARPEVAVQGDTFTHATKADEAALELWDKAILRIEGYGVPEYFTREQWKERMEARVDHVVQAVQLLQEVYVVPGEEDGFEADTRAVTLEAGWNEKIFLRLVHRFRAPLKDDALEYRRTAAQSFTKRGKRSGAARAGARLSGDAAVTHFLFPSTLAKLAELYDRFIVEEEGYTGTSHRQMDPLHKQAAVTALFDPPKDDDEDE